MLQIAKILKSDGTDGGLLISARDIALEDIDPKEPVYIEFDGLPVPFFIEDIRPKGTSKAVVHVTDVRSLEDAEELVGKEVFAGYFEEEQEEESFEGWTLLDKGVVVGTVDSLEPIPGNPCLSVLRPDGQEVMIPLHEDFILSADRRSRKLDLDLPAGLL